MKLCKPWPIEDHRRKRQLQSHRYQERQRDNLLSRKRGGLRYCPWKVCGHLLLCTKDSFWWCNMYHGGGSHSFVPCRQKACSCQEKHVNVCICGKSSRSHPHPSRSPVAFLLMTDSQNTSNDVEQGVPFATRFHVSKCLHVSHALGWAPHGRNCSPQLEGCPQRVKE